MEFAHYKCFIIIIITSNGFNFRIINSLMHSWGVRLTWFDCNAIKILLNVLPRQMAVSRYKDYACKKGRKLMIAGDTSLQPLSASKKKKK